MIRTKIVELKVESLGRCYLFHGVLDSPKSRDTPLIAKLPCKVAIDTCL